ncbi:hypothetical protein PYW08_012168 [Mythimna loreyi]|uniref:Uncharacterized protein n=1 Tax=Mythimna loreyi TaxID=667449 RepID=A0ACC2PZJ0_9NEOP|nr:hypothetical protein PYW08_012168 [Mythimna loreyi]
MSTEELHEEVVEALDEEFLSADVDTTCTICQAEFLDAEDLNVHLHQIHNITSAGSKLCWFCSYYYSDLIDFAEHFRDKHLTNLFYCVHCLRAFTDEDLHRGHEKKHKRGYKSAYCCSQCSEKFSDLHNLRKHDIVHHNNNDDGIVMQPHLPYLSAILNVKAETVLVSLRTDTVYICVACSYSTGSVLQFIKHSATSKCKTLVCEKCSNVYKRRSSMRQHIHKICGKRNVYKNIECPDCNVIFNTHEFKNHKKTCKVIKCYTCNIQYNTMYELSEHQSQEHPLSVELKACTFCWKQCVGSVALQKHIDRSHKPYLHLYKYMCVYCKTPYKHPQKLFGHFFTKHKDIEPYTCNICNKTFRLRKRFTLHIKLEHKSEGYVQFDENYHVYFSDKKSENGFIPKSLFVDTEKKEPVPNTGEDSNMSLLNMNSEISVTETEGNQTELEAPPKPSLKRKRGPKKRKKETDETITIESSDDETLLVVKKRSLKQLKQSPQLTKFSSRWSKKQQMNNRKRFTCKICNKYCYTFQNYNHHMSLHSKSDFKSCIKCSKVFKSKEKLNQHIAMQHSSSKLTDTLKYMLEKRKKGESITDDLPMSEKFRRTIKKVECEEAQTSAKIKEIDNRLSVQKFIENFTPEAENKADIIINNVVTFKAVYGLPKEPKIKMTKFEPKPTQTSTKLSMPVKFKPGPCEKAPASIKLVQPVPIIHDDSQDHDYQSYDDNNYNFMDRNDSIPEVAEEVMLEGTEEAPKSSYIPHKIVIPMLPAEYKDLRIAHLLPQAPYYKIVKVNEVLNKQNENVRPENPKRPDIKLPDGTKLVNTNPLAHLLGKTPIEKVLEPLKNKYYKSKVRDFQGMLAEALSNLERPAPKKKREKDESLEVE